MGAYMCDWLDCKREADYVEGPLGGLPPSTGYCKEHYADICEMRAQDRLEERPEPKRPKFMFLLDTD